MSNGSNIDFNIDKTYYTYAVKRTDASGKSYYVDVLPEYRNKITGTDFSVKETGLGGRKSTDGKTIGVDETSVYLKVTVHDKAGNKAEEISKAPVLIDVKAPVVSNVAPVLRDGAITTTSRMGSEDYTAVKNLSDVTGVTLNITDNTSTNITVTCKGGSKTILKCAEDEAGVYSGTISLTENDFTLIEKDSGGAEYYRAVLTVSDEAQNTTNSYLYVVVDNTAPYANNSYDSPFTESYTTENVTLRQYMYISDYETADMLKIALESNGKVDGEPVLVVRENGYSYIELTLKDNTTGSAGEPSDVYVTVTDALGNTSDKIYFITQIIDRTSPVVTITPAGGNNTHEGTFAVTVSDNKSLDRVDAALMKDGAEPKESDYFSYIWPQSTIMKSQEGSMEDDLGYAPSYARLNIESESDSSLAGSFEYSCLPEGNYTLYIRSKDKAGNTTITRHNFRADNSPPEVRAISYSPSPGMKTGGSVSVYIETDQPVTIQKNPYYEEDSFVEHIKELVRDFMVNGFTYWYDTDGDGKAEKKNLTIEELELRFLNYWCQTAILRFSINEAAEEVYIKTVIEPLLGKPYDQNDYECFVALRTYHEKYEEIANRMYMDALLNSELDKETSEYISGNPDEDLAEDIYLFGDIFPDAKFSNVPNSSGNAPLLTGNKELYKMKELLWNLGVIIIDPDYFDDFRIWQLAQLNDENRLRQYYDMLKADVEERVNSYYAETGEGINGEIFKIWLENYIDYDDFDELETEDEELWEYATGISLFSYPEDIDLRDADTKDVATIQAMRDAAMTLFSKEFAHMGKTDVGLSFETKNTVIYEDNAHETLYAVNKHGQATPFEIYIDNIDPANAPSYTPDMVKLVYRNGDQTEDVTTHTVRLEDIDKVRFIADAGGNKNLYFYDFKLNGSPLTVSESVYDGTTVSEAVYGIGQNPFFIANEELIRADFPDFENMTFYQAFEADLEGQNGIITFSYLDLTFAGQDGKTYRADSSYLVNIFDREPPEGIIRYSENPDKPTNNDIIVSVVNVRDNRTAEGAIKVYYEDGPGRVYDTSYTFSKNGSVTFVLEDYAGNTSYLTATVTGIDKTAPEIEGKFYIGDREYPAVPDAFGVYKYDGPYTNGNITARVTDSDSGEVYYTYVFNHNETISVTVSDAAGNKSTMDLGVDKFDSTAPVPDRSSIRYYVEGREFTGTSTNKNVAVRFEVTDHVTSDPSSPTTAVAVSGLNMKIDEVRKENGVVYTTEKVQTDAGLVKYLGGNLFELEFEYNGTADISFRDEAGNEAAITITVDMIDKIPPSVLSEVRTSEKGVPVNKPVTIAVYPDELCDGWITNNKGDVLVQRRGLSTAALTYTFDKENDGDSNMVWFHFEDASGNVMEYQVTAYDIDLTPPVLKYELVAVNKGVPVDKVLPIDKDEAEKLLIPKNGVATYRISVDTEKSTVTGTSRTLDQFTGGLMEGDTVELMNRSNEMYHTFMENGEYIFYYRDKAGNVSYLTVPVNCIDDNEPDAQVLYTPAKEKGNTKEDVVITISPYDIDAYGNVTDNAYVYWNGKNYRTESGNTFTYTVTRNGSYEFIVIDDSGNSRRINATVSWIDKEAPVIQTEGSANIYVSAGSEKADAGYIKDEIRKVVITDNMDGNIPTDDARVTVSYYLDDGVTPVDINSVDFSKEGEYVAVITARDSVGNETRLPRKITILGKGDVLPCINEVEIMPSSYVSFDTGDLTLTIKNLENAGGTVYYTFVQGEYHPAELKGFNKKAITADKNEAKLQTTESGIYTLVITTQERKTMVAYIFVGSSSDE